MDFVTHIREAVLNLFVAKLRSFLAILGILVGTGSVVALISSSQLATAHALEQFKTLGTNLLSMDIEASEAQTTGRPAKLSMSDIPSLVSASPQIVLAAPYTNLYQDLVYKGKQMNGQILGATSALAEIAKIRIARGRFVSILDHNNYYCVVGAKVAQQIQGMGDDPLYKQLLVGRRFFTIIGIAQPWQPNLFLYADIDNGIIIPIGASKILSNSVAINNVLFRLVPQPNVNAVQAALKARMSTILPTANVDFRNPQQIIQMVAKQRTTFTLLLAAIGGISLMVGGIGVMNIMLVSVVERRNEIGIRMAIGARQGDILQMFLIEAIILTLFGGLIGIIFGVSISLILALVSHWQFHLYPLPPILGFVVSVLVGIISGFYPAFNASRMDPIHTLQAE